MERREKERVRNISVWLPLMWPPLGTRPATHAGALTGNPTSDPLVRSPRSIHWATAAGLQHILIPTRHWTVLELTLELVLLSHLWLVATLTGRSRSRLYSCPPQELKRVKPQVVYDHTLWGRHPNCNTSEVLCPIYRNNSKDSQHLWMLFL